MSTVDAVSEHWDYKGVGIIENSNPLYGKSEFSEISEYLGLENPQLLLGFHLFGANTSDGAEDFSKPSARTGIVAYVVDTGRLDGAFNVGKVLDGEGPVAVRELTFIHPDIAVTESTDALTCVLRIVKSLSVTLWARSVVDRGVSNVEFEVTDRARLERGKDGAWKEVDGEHAA